MEKLRLLSEIAEGLVDLHTAGIVHADIKCENILLSQDLQPHIKLADFGLSLLQQQPLHTDLNTPKPSPADVAVHVSQTKRTTRTRGTLLYCAPEMLVNPYQISDDARNLAIVCKPSRSTDMYAFGILTWQVLSQRRPFTDITSEAMLCSLIHRKHRPPLDKLPSNTPIEVRYIRMIVYICTYTLYCMYAYYIMLILCNKYVYDTIYSIICIIYMYVPVIC